MSVVLLGALSAGQAQAPSGTADDPLLPPSDYDPDNDPLRPPRQPAPPLARLRILLIDLNDLLAEPMIPGAEQPETAFRHTFGSRRATPPEQQTLAFDPATVDPDIVLMRNVVNLRLARRLFPARSWRIVRARTPIAERNARAVRYRGFGPAIAVRLQRGVRVAGFDPSMDDYVASTVRLTVQGETVWLAVCAAATSPTDRTDDCAALGTWTEAKRQEGARVIVGGWSPTTTGADENASITIDPGPETAMPIPEAQPITPMPTGRGTIRASAAGTDCARVAKRQPSAMPIAGSVIGISVPTDRSTALRMRAWAVAIERPVGTNDSVDNADAFGPPPKSTWGLRAVPPSWNLRKKKPVPPAPVTSCAVVVQLAP